MKCLRCKLEKWVIGTRLSGVRICPRCDTAPYSGVNPRYSDFRAGPPSVEQTDDDGWFEVPPGWPS